MGEYKNLVLSVNNNILLITINRLEKLNALNHDTLEEIREAVQTAYDDESIRGIVFTGAGEKAFVAGADIKEIAGLSDVNARKFAENGQEIFDMIEKCPKPVIAAVNGFALGGGCELAMACHIRVASDNAKFALPEVSLGIIPGYGGTQRLPMLVGKGKAFEMIMTGDMISSEEALKSGLVNHIATRENLIPKCLEILNKIKEKAPIAISQVVECVNASLSKEENGFQTEANSFGICCKTDDFKEGTSAFLEKRKAEFKAT